MFFIKLQMIAIYKDKEQKMVSCLGLYIENNLIKYAKVSKDKEGKKIEAYGVKFYDRIEEGIRQIVEETYSYKIPICINLTEEMYQYFDMFSLLSKNDLDKAVEMEFEAYCSDNGFNASVFETRYAVVEGLQDAEKLKVIFVSDNRLELNKRMQLFEKYRLTGVYPLSIALPTISKQVAQQNSIIVNIEEHTTITTIINKKVFDVKVLDQGSTDFLDRINLKENSYAKAYEVCKETTIYTSEGKELTEKEAGYLELIMPVLYPIVGQVQKTMNESMEKIENVYITGTAALINNIDLYFQEYLENAKCEILKPDFVARNADINIKDYIEVNSAIAIALMGIGEGISGMNFKKNTVNDKLKDFFKLEFGAQQGGRLISNDLKQPLDRTEKSLLNVLAGFFILFVVYTAFSLMLKQSFAYKGAQADESIKNSNKQISLVEQDDSAIKEVKNDYTTRIENIRELNNRINERNQSRGALPGLLNQLMNVIPDEVKINSIETEVHLDGKPLTTETDTNKMTGTDETTTKTSEAQSEDTTATGNTAVAQDTTTASTTDTTGVKTNHVVIEVESAKYEQIAFLIGSIKTDVILTNVISTSGQKESNVIKVTIEGDLP